jgi:hypothetical protein
MKTTTMNRPDPLFPEPPFSRSYWAVPGQILAGFYPGDRDPAVAMNKLNALLNCGVTHFCSLMEAGESDHAGRSFEDYRPGLGELATQRDEVIRLMNYPIRDVSVPTVPRMIATLDALDAALAEGAVIYLHCWGGRGRTGTVLGCWFARQGERDALGKLEALTATRRTHFPMVPETPSQQRFVSNWRAGQ